MTAMTYNKNAVTGSDIRYMISAFTFYAGLVSNHHLIEEFPDLGEKIADTYVQAICEIIRKIGTDALKMVRANLSPDTDPDFFGIVAYINLELANRADNSKTLHRLKVRS